MLMRPESIFTKYYLIASHPSVYVCLTWSLKGLNIYLSEYCRGHGTLHCRLQAIWLQQGIADTCSLEKLSD